MNALKFAAVGLSFLVAGSAWSAQLVVTPASVASKSGSASVALDIVTEGNVSGINFFVRTGEIKADQIDISKCTAELPKGFIGHCAVRADGVGVIAYAEDKATFAAGVTTVGSLGLPAEFLAKGRRIQIEELTMADVEGDLIPSETIVAAD